jgi:uncharacterized protein
MTRVSDISPFAIIQRPRLSSGSLPLLSGSPARREDLAISTPPTPSSLPRGPRLSSPLRLNRVDIKMLRGSTRLAISSSPIPSASRKASRPSMRASLGRARYGQIRPHQGRACHNQYAACRLKPLKLIEIHREDNEGLPALMAQLHGKPWRFLVFCDDLSFDGADTSYKSLKAVGASAKCFILRNVEPPSSFRAR